MLDPQSLAAHLLSRGVLSPDVVDRELRIVARRRRNANFEVLVSHRTGYFTKEARRDDGLLAVEGAFYATAAKTRAARTIAKFLPRLCDFDADPGILVLQLIRPADDLYGTVVRTRRVGRNVAGQLGRAIAALHSWCDGHGLADSDVPWVLSLRAPTIEFLRDISAANLELLRIVQHSTALCRCLELLERDWRREGPIHGDLRFANCVITRRGVRSKLKLVDWELCGVGDPAWDLGCIFAAFLSAWVGSIPLRKNGGPASRARSAEVPLANLQPALGTFWSAYIKEQHFSKNESAAVLLRSARFTAARLVQTAYEQLQYSAEIHRTAVVLLQVAANVAVKPRLACSALLGTDLQ